MEQNHISSFQFNDKGAIKISEVGGKGFSLINMTRASINIPPGFVLTVEFFRPWIQSLKTTQEWNSFLESSKEEIFKRSGNLAIFP